MKVISFYTEGDEKNYYKQCADRLIRDCDKYQIDLDFPLLLKHYHHLDRMCLYYY